MTGQFTVDLGQQIMLARATLNEHTAIQGPNHPSTKKAALALRELNDDARYLFSPRHD